jgi:hypothetical protein
MSGTIYPIGTHLVPFTRMDDVDTIYHDGLHLVPFINMIDYEWQHLIMIEILYYRSEWSTADNRGDISYFGLFVLSTKTIDFSAITGIVNTVTRLVDNYKHDLRRERCDVGGGGGRGLTLYSTINGI